MPSLLIRKGYSSVPWMLPRYLTMRKAPGRDLVHDPVVKVMTQSATYSSRPYLVIVRSPTLAGDNSSYTTILEPEKEPAQLRPEDRFIAKAGEESFQGIDRDTFRADLVDHRPEPE